MSEHAHRDRALDLVYGEVEGVEARALRDELERCPECAPELAKLEGAKRLADALPLAPMPSTARAALIAAARVKANETIAALPAEDRRAAVVPREGWWDRTRRFLLGPQTAMAAVMLLVVAIGVMVVPTGDELPVGATTMRPEPDLAPDVATTPEADTLAEREPTPNPAPAQIAEAAEPSPDVAANGADVPVRRVRATSTSAGTTADRVAANAPEAERNVVARGAEAQNVEASLGDSFAYDGVAQQGNLGRGARAAEPRLAPLEEPAPPPPTMPSDDLDSESQALAPAAQELAPRALHQSARSRANAGDCRGAVRVYSDLFARFPAYSELPRALVEAAACQRQLGNLAQARTLLVRAEGYPSTQADAQRELRRLSTVQQAHRRAQRSIPAPASVDSTPAY